MLYYIHQTPSPLGMLWGSGDETTMLRNVNIEVVQAWRAWFFLSCEKHQKQRGGRENLIVRGNTRYSEQEKQRKQRETYYTYVTYVTHSLCTSTCTPSTTHHTTFHNPLHTTNKHTKHICVSRSLVIQCSIQAHSSKHLWSSYILKGQFEKKGCCEVRPLVPQ